MKISVVDITVDPYTLVAESSSNHRCFLEALGKFDVVVVNSALEQLQRGLNALRVSLMSIGPSSFRSGVAETFFSPLASILICDLDVIAGMLPSWWAQLNRYFL